MRLFFNLFVFALVFGNFNLIFGQSYEISGVIVDAESKDPIPFANIALKDIYKGTASNDLGEFSFKADSLPMVLVITHLSYEPAELVVSQAGSLTVELTPGKLLMNELVIKARGNNQYAYDLIERAYNTITGRSGRSQYGKAFYRQISKNGDEYSELYEIFYDTKYTLNGVEDWAIQEGRYALKLSTADSFIYNKNFTLMVRLLTIVQPKTEDLIMPVSENVEEQYDLNLEQILSVNNREVAQIRFTKKDYIKLPAMEGVISIDVDSHNVLKIQGKIVNDNLKFITLKGEKGSWKNYSVSFEIGFKPLEDDQLALEYMRLGQNFDYYFDGAFANEVETRSFLTYYEYYKPPKRKKLGGRLMRFNKRDSDLLDNIGYNQSFWDENIIVKRTPLESEVIASFEEERAFGSIYLNNKNQIVLEDYEIDSDPFIVRAREQLKAYNLPKNGEKVYLHLDKPYYASGEKVWLKSYTVNMASNILIDHNAVLTIDLVNPGGEILASELLYVKDGLGYGQMDLPEDLKSGEYKLRAYSSKMTPYSQELYFTKKLDIYNPSVENMIYDKTLRDSVNSLEFYPEGGSLIESMPMQIGFLAKDQFGDPLEIKGRLVSEEGRQISALKSEPNGRGSIFVMPKLNLKYRSMVQSHEIERIYFPKVEKMGYSVMVNNLKPNTIDVTIRGTMKLEGEKFYLLVVSNGILYDRRIGALTRGLYKAEIPKTNLPNGITQILLVDEAGVIMCKRLVLLNQPEEVVVKYYLSKRDFRRRDRIDLVLDLQDQDGKSVSEAFISVSIVDKDKVSRNPLDRNIRSYFHLGFIADNTITNEGELFSDHERETLKNLDFIMLSQQFVLPQIETFDSLQVLREDIKANQKEFTFSGVVKDAQTGKPLDGGVLKIISYPNALNGFILSKIDNSGRFEIEEAILGDSIEVVITAIDKAGNMKAVTIDFNGSSKSLKSKDLVTKKLEMPERGKKYVEYKQREAKELSAYEVEDTKAVSHKSFKLPTLLEQPDFTTVIDNTQSKAKNLLAVFDDRFPGLNVTGKELDAKIRIRGNQGSPVILLDGLTIEEYLKLSDKADELSPVSSVNSSTAEFLSGIDPVDIHSVEIYKDGNEISQYYENSNNGIICIYSKPGKNAALMAELNGLQQTRISGFTYPEKFVSPEYLGNDKADFEPDMRTTLYWNPDIKTNRRGRAKIGFYNSDDARNLQICVEGITSDGIPIFDIHEIGRDTRREKLK